MRGSFKIGSKGGITRDVERIMAHYDEAATLQSPSVLAPPPASNGVVSGRVAIRELSARLQR